MIREQTLRARQKLVGKLPITGELLRGHRRQPRQHRSSHGKAGGSLNHPDRH
jgi:hypothetical protein